MQDKEMQKYAEVVDNKLNQAQYKTIVHGDAKLANFLFNDQAVSAVDFQYVGGGVGVKDVAYFLSSIYSEKELIENEKACLDCYFSNLNHPAVENEWRQLYPFAWCDFYRFLNGWSPEHDKVHEYTKQMRDKVIKWISI